MKFLVCFLVVVHQTLLCACQTDGDIKFYLFTRTNKAKSQKQLLRNGDVPILQGSNFNASKPTKVLIHGWKGGLTTHFLMPMKNALLDRDDVNVIVVDWGKLAKTPYGEAAKNTRFVGAATARLIEFIGAQTGASRKKLHLIGHSLGGQTVGFAGQNLDPRPARVTGLDTAEYGFNAQTPKDYLDPTDADFVDEIYGKVSNNKRIKGHANFFPNGGKDAHKLIPYYFISSVMGGRCSYPVFKCGTFEQFKGGCRSTDGNHMGYYAVKPASGRPTSYFLNATRDSPCA